MTKVLTDTNGKVLINAQGAAYEAPAGGSTPVSHPNPTISVNTSTGLITASHTQESGEVTGGTTTATEQLTTQGAQTITPTTSDQTIAACKFLIGAQTIKGDANLLSANIKKDVSIFGVNGSYEGSGGGGNPTAESDDVNFFDYDGSILYSYTAAEFAQLAALPANPSHEGLMAQGWNWTLADAKAQAQAMGYLDIGQCYVTTDGKTRIYVRIPLDGETITLRYSQTASAGVTINWGDGSTEETSSGTGNKIPTHTYNAAGSYVITLTRNSGDVQLGTGSALVAPVPYMEKVLIGANVTALSNSCFSGATNLRLISMPTTVATIGTYCFNNSGIIYVTLPSGITVLQTSCFDLAYGLCNVSIPKSANDWSKNSIFDECYRLRRVSIPSAVTSFGTYTFYHNDSMNHLILPSGATAIPARFTAHSGVFYLTIPSGVTSIGDYAFYSMDNVKIIYVLPTTPPTLGGTHVFDSLPSSARIHVPNGKLSAYQSAENWAEYASKMVEMPA